MGEAHRVKFHETMTFSRSNPTEQDAIARADGDRGGVDLSQVPRIRPMRIERLIAMGPPYTEEDRARLLYHQIGSEARVAEQMGRSRDWTRKVLAHDIAERRQERKQAG